MTELDARLLQAHAACDAFSLVTLYREASAAANDPVAQRFYLTHAYVFALEIGDARSEGLRAELVALGAEPQS